MQHRLLLAAAGLLPAALTAAPPASANYTLPALSLSAAGGLSTSASYRLVSDTGAATGPATAPAFVAKPGFIGQLYEVTALEVSDTTGGTLLEATQGQLLAAATLDDATALTIAPETVAWSILSGPLTSISTAGIVTAGNVYQNTPAFVQGTFLGGVDTDSLTIRNTGDDDYLLYAADGLPDLWQVGWFGEQNPLAAPGADADSDGQDNLFEFLAGYVPTDPASLLAVCATGLGSGTYGMELSRVQPGTRYRFERSSDLVNWHPLLTLDPSAVTTPFSQSLPAPGARDFYRVLLSKP